ncbi:haloacid dehalogenase type II [Nocardia sp. NPDC057668]|uniref:haloacid dehalogenase type II n=1 Tax=Nocardia sp. NPDC057668 TaxID=3346202 RepID=UPI00366F03B6
MPGSRLSAPQALLFDVQGTATDFFSTVTGTARRVAGAKNPAVDWPEFVNAWRAAYFRETSRERRATDAWISVDSIYRSTLDELITARNLELDENERREVNASWKLLTPWPDVVPGLRRLRRDHVLATLSNADVDAVVSITRHGDLPWHAVFTAEMAGVFKPDPVIYHLAARYLGLPPSEIMMVASHKYDIRAAARLGFRTAFISRPDEFGDPALADAEFSDEFDINARDFQDLADQLGC